MRFISLSSPREEASRRDFRVRRATRFLKSQYQRIFHRVPKATKLEKTEEFPHFARPTEQLQLAPKALERRKPQNFPQFARLPDELQLVIWRFAVLLPRVIEFGEGTRIKLASFGRQARYLRTIVDHSGVHPLLVTTFTSRQVALGILGEAYAVDFIPQFRDGSMRICYGICFRPHNNTIYVPDVWTLEKLSRDYHIDQGPWSRTSCSVLAVVKSFALDGLCLPTTLRTALRVPGRGRHFEPVEVFLCSMIELISLEELIFIAPTIQKEVPSRTLTGKQYRKLVSLPKTEQKEQLKDLLGFVSQKLKEDMQQNRLLGRRRDTSPSAISDWWENPKITVMSRGQFKARFSES